jgi:tRNA U34 2-thiouridine synthase MnmA/TrmU
MLKTEEIIINKKAVMLLSGGLDSSVALKMVLDQGIEVTAVNFRSPFCCCNRKNGCGNEALRLSKELGIPLKMISVDREYIEMIRNPRHGYGKRMNPCLDCRIFMHTKAAEYMESISATFLVTGEVLGQRPMSQRRDAMNVIDRETGLKGKILRPLSAQVLEPTLPEQQGIVDRNRLLAITGRGRKKQMELAEAFSISDYPCPAGGCLLTDANFAVKLKDLFDHQETFEMAEIRLLRTGRHLRIATDLKAIIGRNEQENSRIESLAKTCYPLFIPRDFTGPIGAAAGTMDERARDVIPRILLRYGRTAGPGTVVLRMNGSEEVLTAAEPLTEEELERYRIRA